MTIIIELTPKEINELRKPIKGRGGWQSTIKYARSRLKGAELRLSPFQLAKIVTQVRKYGAGGYQGRLDPIVSQLNILLSELGLYTL
jgi:hypothetical protein